MDNLQHNQVDNQRVNLVCSPVDNLQRNPVDNQRVNLVCSPVDNHQDNQVDNQRANHQDSLLDNLPVLLRVNQRVILLDNQVYNQQVNLPDNQVDNLPHCPRNQLVLLRLNLVRSPADNPQVNLVHNQRDYQQVYLVHNQRDYQQANQQVYQVHNHLVNQPHLNGSNNGDNNLIIIRYRATRGPYYSDVDVDFEIYYVFLNVCKCTLQLLLTDHRFLLLLAVFLYMNFPYALGLLSTFSSFRNHSFPLPLPWQCTA